MDNIFIERNSDFPHLITVVIKPKDLINMIDRAHDFVLEYEEEDTDEDPERDRDLNLYCNLGQKAHEIQNTIYQEERRKNIRRPSRGE